MFVVALKVQLTDHRETQVYFIDKTCLWMSAKFRPLRSDFYCVMKSFCTGPTILMTPAAYIDVHVLYLPNSNISWTFGVRI